MKGSSFYGKMKSTGSPLNQTDPMAKKGETKEETQARLMAELDKQHDRKNWKTDTKYIPSDELKEGDYMTYKTDMYNKDGTPRTNITEEQTSELQKDKTGRLFATNLDNPSDTIYATPPVVPKKPKKK